MALRLVVKKEEKSKWELSEEAFLHESPEFVVIVDTYADESGLKGWIVLIHDKKGKAESIIIVETNYRQVALVVGNHYARCASMEHVLNTLGPVEEEA